MVHPNQILRKIVGRHQETSKKKDLRTGGGQNKTAESELLVEFTKLNSRPVSPSGSMHREEGEFMRPDFQTRKTQQNWDQTHFKYAHIWQRARAKLKSRLMLASLRKELNLYGSSLTAQTRTGSTTVAGDVEVRTGGCYHLVLPPHSSFLDVWQLVLASLVLYTATVFPYRMAFVEDYSSAFSIADLAVDLCFVFDILINLNSAYINADFELVTDRSLIFKRYVRHLFILDLLSCSPIATNELWLGSQSSQGQYSELLRLLRLPRLYRLVKIIRILDTTSPSGQNRILEKCKEVLKLNHGTVKLLSTVMMIFICIHLAACFWYLSARMADFSPNTWVVRIGQANEPPETIYIASVYWAVTTLATVGYGDINGYTNTERLLCIAWMFCGVYFFSFTIGSLTSFLSNIDTKCDSYRENMLVSKLAVIEEFAKDARLKTSLKNELRAAIQYTTERSGLSWSDKQNILSELPKKLRYELALAMHQGAAKSLDFFQGKDPVFVSAMVPFMQPLLVRANSPIFRQGEYADETYFIVHGRVSYILEEGGFVYKTLHQGSYFGDIEVIMVIPRKYSVSAAIDSNLLTMKKPLMETIESDFPAYWKEMRSLAEARDKVNDKARKEFSTLMTLKKAGKLEKSDPESVREKVKRLSSSSVPLLSQVNPSVSVTLETLNFAVLESIKSAQILASELNATKSIAEAVLDALKIDGIRVLPHRGKLRKLFVGKDSEEREK